MRWWIVALGAAVLVGVEACNRLPAPPQGLGELDFQKDSITCTDTVNTELYIDTVSQGQFTMRPGSIEGFTEPYGQHIAKAIERAGTLRQFKPQTITVPLEGIGTYVMKCAVSPPPAAPPAKGSPGR